jgi:hypothetical protein
MVHQRTMGTLIECEAIHMRNVEVPDRVIQSVRRKDHLVAGVVLVPVRTPIPLRECAALWPATAAPNG